MEDLGINVKDGIGVGEGFGKVREALKKMGIAGTLQLTQEDKAHEVIDAAWKLSKGTGKPVIIVVRGS